MRLSLRNIGFFVERVLRLPDSRVTIVREPTAAGKTTIARVLYAFMSGRVEGGLLRYGAGRGEAELQLDGYTYRLVVEPGGGRVDRVLGEPYSVYLVFTELTPLYTQFYTAPPRRVSVDELVGELVKPPPELHQLEAELKRLEPEAFDIDSLIEFYEGEVERRRRRLRELEVELSRIEREIEGRVPLEGVGRLLEKRGLEERVAELKRRLEEARREHARLLVEVQSGRYGELRERRERVAGEVERLRRELDRLGVAREGFEKLREGLGKLRGVVDLLHELGIPVLGQLASPEAIEVFMGDCDAAIRALAGRHASVSARVAELERELSSIDRELAELQGRHQRLTALEVEVERLGRELRDLEYRLSMAEREVQRILGRLGLTEGELLERVSSGDTARLMERRRRIREEMERVERELRDFQRSLEYARARRSRVVERAREYRELRRRYSTLKASLSERRGRFRDAFTEGFRGLLGDLGVRDFNLETLERLRPAHTYSQGERLAIALAYQYGLVKALLALGFKVPLVAVDLLTPLTPEWRRKILSHYSSLGVRTVFLETGEQPEITVYR